MHLLGMPVELLSVGAMSPELESSKRITAVKAFYEDPKTPNTLRQDPPTPPNLVCFL